jgi:protein-disulfide isomerase
MPKILFALLAALPLAGTVPAAAVAQPPQMPQPPGGSNAAAAQPSNLLAIGKQDRVLGNPAAPITIIEYGSLTCPHCAHFQATVLPHVKQQWIDTGKAKLVFRDFPLDREAMAAEIVARCAPPAHYYPLIDMIFANQDKWVAEKDWQAALQRLVQLAGIGRKQFDACLADKAIADQVVQSRLIASQQLGVDATPTLFINGKEYKGEPTVEAFDQALSAAAQKS